MMRDAVVAGFSRSPFCFARKGELARTRPDDLAAQVIAGLLARTGVAAEDVEDVLLGCAFPEGEQGMNLARMAGFIAGLPQTVAAATINRFCGSSMHAVHVAAGAIQLNAGEVFICAGVELMTRVPVLGFNFLPNPALQARYPQAYASMGETAENVARKWQVTRAAQEEFATTSHAKAAAAQAQGRFDSEIVAITDGNRRAERDGCIRPETSPATLAGLKPAFDQAGTVTAGTSSPLTDGAAAVLVCSADYAKRHGLAPLATIKSAAVAGCAPELMGIGPIAASRKALDRAGITVRDVDVIEINEAFASQSIACIRELNLDPAKTNIDGGAIALGHPLGATGARIVGKAASLLKRVGGRYALVTQCIGGGQGIATVLEAA